MEITMTPGKLYSVSITRGYIKAVGLYRSLKEVSWQSAAPLVDQLKHGEVILWRRVARGTEIETERYSYAEVLSPRGILGWMIIDVMWYSLSPFDGSQEDEG